MHDDNSANSENFNEGKFGPRVVWRGTTGSSEEGLISISFDGKTGGIVRLTTDFDSATKLKSSLESFLPNSVGADLSGADTLHLIYLPEALKIARVAKLRNPVIATGKARRRWLFWKQYEYEGPYYCARWQTPFNVDRWPRKKYWSYHRPSPIKPRIRIKCLSRPLILPISHSSAGVSRHA